jgi:hypothetical protein
LPTSYARMGCNPTGNKLSTIDERINIWLENTCNHWTECLHLIVKFYVRVNTSGELRIEFGFTPRFQGRSYYQHLI